MATRLRATLARRAMAIRAPGTAAIVVSRAMHTGKPPRRSSFRSNRSMDVVPILPRSATAITQSSDRRLPEAMPIFIRKATITRLKSIRMATASAMSMPGKRSEERRVGKECGSTCRSRWAPYHYNNNKKHKSDTKDVTKHVNDDYENLYVIY